MTQPANNEDSNDASRAKPKGKFPGLPFAKPTSGPGSGSGGRLGNANAQRHGMRGGKLPKGCEYIENRVNALRRQVEAAILDAKGEINIVDAAAVNSILKWERHGLLASHWLRHEAGTLSTSDRLRFSEAVAKASDARDRNIRALGLDRDAKDSVIELLYARARPSSLTAALPAPSGQTASADGAGGVSEGK